MKQVEIKAGKGIGKGIEKALPLPVLSLISVFCLFLFTLHPSITAGDSGEISAAAFSLGIPHPSGYPLYVIVAKSLALAIPFGNIAYRVNIASAIFGALSCWMVYLITERILQGNGQAEVEVEEKMKEKKSLSLPSPLPLPASLSLPLPAAFAAFSLALSHELWYRSTVAEVYTLNTFLILLIIYVLLLWREEISGQWSVVSGREMLNTPYASRYLYLAAFLLGIGIGNHHTIVLVVPGAAAFILLGSRDQGVRGSILTRTLESSNPRTLLCLTFFFLLGLSVYLYLPIRSAQNPFMDWGDPQGIHNFIDVFTRKAYLPEGIERTWGRLIEQARSFNPVSEFSLIGIFLGLLGVWGVFRKDRAVGAMLILTFLLASYGLIFLAGSSKADMGLLKKFYLPAYAVFSMLIGVGIATILKSGGMEGLRLTSHVSRLMLLLAALSIIWQLAAHFPRANNSDSYLAYDYGMNELNSLHEGAAYISKGEIKTFPLWYLQGVERYREEVKVVTAYFLTQRWYLKEALKIAGVPREIPQGLTYKQMQVNSIYGGNADKGVYTGFLDEEYIPKVLSTYTQGITFQLYKKPEERFEGDVWSMYRLRGVGRVEEWMDRGMVEILKDYASSHYNTGLKYYDEGDKDRAMTEFEKALAINPDDADSLNNLAVLYAEKGIKLKEAESMARKAFELYTGEKDREMARETIEEIQKKR